MTAAAVHPTRFEEATGLDPGTYPVVAERLAIDATGALRAAESGLRALRSRAFLRRLWDGVTGAGQELASAVGQDLVAVERATLSIVREVMREEARTQFCVNQVLINLHAVNDDVDELSARLGRAETRLGQQIREESRRLAAQIEEVRRDVQREAAVRRLTELYRAGELHRGAGETLRGALFLAAVGAHHVGSDPPLAATEQRTALAVVRQRLVSRPLSLEEALLRAAEELRPELDEALLYLGQEGGPCLAVVRALAERRMAGLPNTERHAGEAIAVARATRDPDRRLASRLVRPWELAQAIGRELLPDEPMTESEAWKPSFMRSL